MYSKKCIMVVNDEKTLAETMALMLENEGYNVKVFTDSRKALATLRKGLQVEFIITDIQMPWINGFQLAEEAANIIPEAKAIFLSGQITQATRVRARELSVFTVLEKPVHFSELLENITKGLQDSNSLKIAKENTAPKLLIIDDHEPMLDVLSDYFTSRGFQVNTAVSGRESIEKAAREDYQLAIVDIGLPDMNGVDVIRELHQRRPALAIYAYTGEALSNEMGEALKAGAREVLRKPMSLNKLAECIECKEREFEEQKRKKEQVEQQQSQWQQLPCCYRFRVKGKTLVRKYRKALVTMLLTGLCIGFAIWGLITYQETQLRRKKLPQEKSKIDKMIYLMEQGEKYLNRDEQRELLRK